MSRRKAYAAGNWKMHGLGADLGELTSIARAASGCPGQTTVLCLPATLLDRARATGVTLGAQDCHASAEGAHTGDLHAGMLADAGAAYVILGHSERRSNHAETDAVIRSKVLAAWSAGLTAIICIGETEAQYRSGQALEVLAKQIAHSVPVAATPQNTVIAYEPVWAIGTGLTPEPQEIAMIHAAIRKELPDPRLSILYGGSMSPQNAAEIFEIDDVDGGLVGRASLKASEFIPILQALDTAKGAL